MISYTELKLYRALKKQSHFVSRFPSFLPSLAVRTQNRNHLCPLSLPNTFLLHCIFHEFISNISRPPAQIPPRNRRRWKADLKCWHRLSGMQKWYDCISCPLPACLELSRWDPCLRMMFCALQSEYSKGNQQPIRATWFRLLAHL